MEKKELTLEEQAEKLRLEDQLEKAKRAKGWFCPQIKGECNHECYCYVPPRIVTIPYGDGSKRSRVREAYCLHLMHQDYPNIQADVNML